MQRAKGNTPPVKLQKTNEMGKMCLPLRLLHGGIVCLDGNREKQRVSSYSIILIHKMIINDTPTPPNACVRRVFPAILWWLG